MTAMQAREYLKTAVATETGRQALRALGFGFIISAPDKGDDAGSIEVAKRLCAKLQASYGLHIPR
jgi:hypothetical protein